MNTKLTLAVPVKQSAARLTNPLRPIRPICPNPKETSGVLASYASHVTSPSEGVVTDKKL